MGYACRDGFSECAEQMYANLVRKGKVVEPGTQFHYLSCHLQFAGAMAVAASGKNIQTLFKEYLYEPFNMSRPSWSPYFNPSMAGGIRTTGNDFEQLMHRLLANIALPKNVTDQMETD